MPRPPPLAFPRDDVAVVVVPDPCPRLLVKSTKRLSQDQAARLRKSIEDTFKGGSCSQAVIFDDGVELYQFIDGIWCPLATPHQPPEVKHPTLPRMVVAAVYYGLMFFLSAAIVYVYISNH